MERCCYLRNVRDKMADGKTASEKRYGQKFEGPSIPFGTLVEYIPITAKGKSRVSLEKTLKGIFLVFVLHAVGGWSGDLTIADDEDFQKSEDSDIYVKGFKSQEICVKRRIRISVCKRES